MSRSDAGFNVTFQDRERKLVSNRRRYNDCSPSKSKEGMRLAVDVTGQHTLSLIKRVADGEVETLTSMVERLQLAERQHVTDENPKPTSGSDVRQRTESDNAFAAIQLSAGSDSNGDELPQRSVL